MTGVESAGISASLLSFHLHNSVYLNFTAFRVKIFFYCDPELHGLTILPSRIRKQQQHQKPQNKPLRKHIQHLEKLVQHNLAYVYTVNRDGSATLYNIYFKMYKNAYIERFFSSFRVTQFQNKFQLLARGSAGRIDGHISIE